MIKVIVFVIYPINLCNMFFLLRKKIIANMLAFVTNS